MKLKPIFLAVAFGVLGGCNMAPKTAHPALPVPEMLSVQGGNFGTSAINPAELDWEQYFTEPRLRDVMQLALDNNRDLRVALANVAQAHALYRVQRSDLFPTRARSLSIIPRRMWPRRCMSAIFGQL